MKGIRMMNIDEIEKKIEEYQKGPVNKHWKDKIIDIETETGKTSFKVNGFGICEDNNFAEESFRYYLEFEINEIKNNKVLTVLLMNPSDKTNPDKNNNIDNTIKNALKIAYSLKYSKIKIFNSFARICGNSNKAKTYYEKYYNEKIENINKNFVKNQLKSDKTEDILLACGDGITKELYQDYLNTLKEFEKNLWTYAKILTTKKRPRHLSIQSKENRKLFKNFINSKEKYYIEIIKNENEKLSIRII